MTIYPRMRLWAATACVSLVAAQAVPVTVRAEQAVAPERNPPGDIPDNQVFILYSSPDGYELKVPEGWARTVADHTTRFADKYGLITVEEGAGTQSPTIASVKAAEIPKLTTQSRAFELKTVTGVALKSGKAVRITYNSNSDPNVVTGRQLRQEHERFIFFRDGKVATLDLAAPVGADNVDQWQLISNSFRWK
jgi:hypothetical protein